VNHVPEPNEYMKKQAISKPKETTNVRPVTS